MHPVSRLVDVMHAHVCLSDEENPLAHNDIQGAHVTARMRQGAAITDLPPGVFKLIVDRLLPTPEVGNRTDAQDFACQRLSSPGVRLLCDPAVRRLDLRHCSTNEMQALLRRFTGAAIPGCHL